MKKTITTLASLAIAASAAAHTSAIPHDHAGSQMNWFALTVGAATVAVATIAIAAIRKNSSRAK